MLPGHLLEDVLEAPVGFGLQEANGQVAGEDAAPTDILGIVWKQMVSVRGKSIEIEYKTLTHLLA